MVCAKIHFCWFSNRWKVRTKYRIAGNFWQFRHLLSLAKFLSVNFLSCVNDYIEDMAIFTALVKIYSTEYFCNTKVVNFCPAKIFGYTVYISLIEVPVSSPLQFAEYACDFDVWYWQSMPYMCRGSAAYLVASMFDDYEPHHNNKLFNLQKS